MEVIIHPNDVVLREGDALGVIDATPTFMPGGGLPVDHGDEVVPVIARVMDSWPNGLLFATEEGHLPGNITWHTSFVDYEPKHMLTYDEVKLWTPEKHRIAKHALFDLHWLKYYLKLKGYQILWDEHGGDGTEDAKVHPGLDPKRFAKVLIKGRDPKTDSYGAVFDALGRSTGFDQILVDHKVKRIFICGLAFDFCVAETAIQLAIMLGYEVYIIFDATRSIDLPLTKNYPGSVFSALSRLIDAGVKFINSDQIVFKS